LGILGVLSLTCHPSEGQRNEHQYTGNYPCRVETICKPPCKHGKCVGPGKCKCLPGYTGKICNHDLNECGLKPRPCKHRCMNTYGSFRCYCLNDYTLMSDGSCADPWACSMRRCQYGCEDLNGLVQCTCPSRGLHLASDARTCLDVNECKMNRVVCSHHKTCVNTFGSYRCKCLEGFDLQYVHGKFQCKDVDECILGKHSCSEHAICYNTPGSYRCECYAGFHGNGHGCSRAIDAHCNKPTICNYAYLRSSSPAELGSLCFSIKQCVNALYTMMSNGHYFLLSTAVRVECKFEEDICDWSQDVSDNLDWELAHRPHSTYMQVSNSPSSQHRRIAKLWLALPSTSSLEVCLSFHYRLVGPWPGHLRIHIRHGDIVGPAVWERSGDGDETWRLSGLTLLPPRDLNTPQSVRGNISSIGLADVVFQSGLCPEHVLEEE
uniref:EGF-like-domain, multiple 6 n=1 Tax=Eptatretus burgeri TaxID=7764 RepID=A0A8C4Q862_EPTBU